MLSLTRKTDYALIALCHLAQESGRICTAREIADRHHLPSALLMNVLKALAHKDLLISIRGAKGGYRLAIPAGVLTLADVIQAVEGPVRFVQCNGHDGSAASDCEILDTCPIRGPIGVIQARLESFLSEITVADLASNLGMTGDSGMVTVNIAQPAQNARSAVAS